MSTYHCKVLNPHAPITINKSTKSILNLESLTDRSLLADSKEFPRNTIFKKIRHIGDTDSLDRCG